MHILEKYALDTAAKIDKPFIFDSFFPLPFQKYISFSPGTNDRQKYLYWSDVIDIIKPIIDQEDIKIIQLDGEKINNCFHISNQINFQNKAYIIKNSILHFGMNNFSSQAASLYEKKIVVLYGDFPPENKKPYWSDPNKVINIFKSKDSKPTYNLTESNNINEIKPEQIAKGIFQLMDIECPTTITTEYIGESYTNKTFEIIPNGFFNAPEQIPNLIIRMDYYFDENVLEFFLSNKKCIIITDKEINPNILIKYRSNIIQIVYEINEANNPSFAEKMKSIGIKYDMISYLDDENLNKFKLKYLDLGLIHPKLINKLPEIILSKKNLLFKSSKILASKEGLFSTKSHWEKNISIKEPPVFIKGIHPKEYENLYIYSIDN